MAADDTKGKKRKGAPDAAPKAKKPRKSDETAAPAKPAKASKSATAPTSTDSKPSKGKNSRKQAADFMSDDEAPVAESAPAKPIKGKKKSKAAADAIENVSESVAPAVEEPKTDAKPKKQGKKGKAAVTEDAPAVEAPKDKAKKPKKGKQTEVAPVEEDSPVEVQAESASKKTKKAKGGKKQAETKEVVVEAATEADEIELDGEEDDQTAALLAGFESDDDENDPEEDIDFDEDANVPALTKKQKTALAKAAIGAKANEPGVIYVGRVPRGFFEPQMKKYFSQFGRVNKLRLSRNKKTGASKHFAFVEFASSEVADIVARTMNNYLLFGHILKCQVVPSDQVHPDLFKGAGQRFKVDPRNKKAGLEMERGVERAQWEKRVEKENKRRSGKTKALKEDFGYEFTAPTVKSVEDVTKQLSNGDEQKLLADAPVEEPKAKKGKKAAKPKEDPQPAETAAPAAEKKTKRATKAKAPAETEAEPEEPAAIEEPVPEKKTKAKRRKSDVAMEVEEAPVAEAPKGKKAKKAAPAAADTPEKKRKAKAEDAAPPKKAKKAKA